MRISFLLSLSFCRRRGNVQFEWEQKLTAMVIKTLWKAHGSRFQTILAIGSSSKLNNFVLTVVFVSFSSLLTDWSDGTFPAGWRSTRSWTNETSSCRDLSSCGSSSRNENPWSNFSFAPTFWWFRFKSSSQPPDILTSMNQNLPIELKELKGERDHKLEAVRRTTIVTWIFITRLATCTNHTVHIGSWRQGKHSILSWSQYKLGTLCQTLPVAPERTRNQAKIEIQVNW